MISRKLCLALGLFALGACSSDDGASDSNSAEEKLLARARMQSASGNASSGDVASSSPVSSGGSTGSPGSIPPSAPTRPATPVIDRLKASGNWNPGWDPFAELDPAWTEKFVDMGMTPLARRVLDPKTWEFIAIAVDASCTHMYAPGVRRHIRRALALLPEELRTLLELGYFAGMSSSEIAEHEQLAIGTVKSRVARALSELRLALRQG